MEAIQFASHDKSLTYLVVDIPTVIDPKDVVIKVAFSGVCGTDLHIIQVFIIFLFSLYVDVLHIVIILQM